MKSFTSTDPVNHQGENTWFTPPLILENLGLFDLDPCSVSFAPNFHADVNIKHDLGECGLNREWRGRVFMNPPYGKEIEPFIKKFKEHDNGIALVFARMGTKWMQEWLKTDNYIFFFRKRIKFINKDNEYKGNPGSDSCFLITKNNVQYFEYYDQEGTLIKCGTII